MRRRSHFAVVAIGALIITLLYINDDTSWKNNMKYQRQIKFLVKLDLLILDDFLLHTISDEREIKVLHELLEVRSELSRSVIVCSQREPKSWTSMMLNDEVSSNAILKRVTKHYTVVINPKNGG